MQKTIARAGVTQLSDWAVGDNVGPTAVSLAFFTASTAGRPRYPGLGDGDGTGDGGLPPLPGDRARTVPSPRMAGELMPTQGTQWPAPTTSAKDTPGGGRVYYQLEDVAVGGGTRHPQQAVQAGATQRVYLPPW